MRASETPDVAEAPERRQRPPHSRRTFLRNTALVVGAGAAGGMASGLLLGPGSLLDGATAEAKATAVADATGATSRPAPFIMPARDRQVEAAHLLRRAGFGGTRSEVAQLAALSREAAAERLLDTSIDDQVDQQILDLGVDVWNSGPGDIQRWWLLRMVLTSRPLAERIALFWHDHFATEIKKVKDPWLMLQQIQLFRDQGLGNFRDLTLAVAKDPAMLLYLDNRLNVKGKPNENYGRELMELHTIGIGHYTETDVKEAARAFTGWSLQRRNAEDYRRLFTELRQKMADTTLTEEAKRELRRQQQLLDRDHPFEFMFRRNQHDEAQKTFRGHVGPFDGADIINILVADDACADSICRKLFAYFAYDNPDKATVERLKRIYFDSGYQIRPIVKAILTSEEFYSDRAYRAQIKSPVEFVVGAVRALEAKTDGRFMATTLRQLAQVLFDPPNPAGWPGGRTWVNGNSIIGRSNFASALASLRPAPTGRPAAANYIDPAVLVTAGVTEAGQVAEVFLRLLVDNNVSTADRNALIEYLHVDDGGAYKPFTLSSTSIDKKVRGLIYLILSSPLYQLA